VTDEQQRRAIEAITAILTMLDTQRDHILDALDHAVAGSLDSAAFYVQLALDAGELDLETMMAQARGDSDGLN
jgi:hypothetical protein